MLTCARWAPHREHRNRSPIVEGSASQPTILAKASAVISRSCPHAPQRMSTWLSRWCESRIERVTGMAMTRELSTTRTAASIQLRRLTYAGCRNRLIGGRVRTLRTRARDPSR